MKSNSIKQPCDIGLAIWKAIVKSGLTCEQVAEKVGVSVRLVYYWQSGTKLPSLANALLLADILGWSLDSLLRN